MTTAVNPLGMAGPPPTMRARRPVLPWNTFLHRFRWEQGEHVSLVGPTGCGKTTLALALLPRREYRAVFGTKPVDPALDELVARGYRRMPKWNPRPGERKVLLWPKVKRFEDLDAQPETFRDALRSIYLERGWTVFVDEARYLVHTLKLTRELQVLWQQGRSLKISLVATTQRPAYMPLEMYDQATHLFFWRDTDKVNLRRISEIGGAIDPEEVKRVVANLGRHDFLYLNTRTGDMIISAVSLESG